MARVKKVEPRKCRRCKFYNTCQTPPELCQDFVDKNIKPALKK